MLGHDLLDLLPLDRSLPQHFIARFLCRGLIRGRDGKVRPADRFEVGIHFPSDYLRRAESFEVLTWLGPPDIFHPNIQARVGAICVGHLAPGVDLVSLLYQLFEIITYQRVTMNERNALDWEEHEYFNKIKLLKVSSHVLIERTGALVQFVPFHLRAWHAGESSFQGRRNCNDYSIGIELEGTDDRPYESAQYCRLAQVLALLRRAYPGITPQRVVGHSHVAPGRKTDPGPSFEWGRLAILLADEAGAT